MEQTAKTGDHFCYILSDVELGERIRLARERAGLSPTEVAKALDCSLTNVLYLESGRNKSLKNTVAAALVDLFNVRLEWLLFGEEPMERNTAHKLVGAAAGLTDAQIDTLLVLIEQLKK